MVDTGALVDTAVAKRAGIGFIGKNGLVISKEYGSYMYLGELITNLEIEPDHEVDYGCGDCRRCLDACPTSCLIGDGTMNARRCLSFQPKIIFWGDDGYGVSKEDKDCYLWLRHLSDFLSI